MIRRVTLAFGACILIASSVLAIAYPLSPNQVREAYFLGRDPDRRQAFFSKYIHFPTQPDTGPDIHLIEFRTPYEQVALRSQENWANYDAQRAEEDYAADPNQTVVRVFICPTLTFSFAGTASGESAPTRPEDYVRGFDFSASQSRPIKPEKLTVRRAFSGCADFDGFEVFLHFRAEQFQPGIARITVTNPDGRTVNTEFDLNQLE